MIDILKNGNPIYRPLEIKSSSISDGQIEIQAYNYSNSNLKNVGVYISSAKNLGEGNLPADFGPHIDFNNIIEWGNKSIRENSYGGLVLIRSNKPDVYFSSRNGSSKYKKIILGDIASGDSITFTVKLESPVNVSSRRLYISINVE